MKHGELLFEIDPQPYQLAVDAAEAQLELAYQSNSQDRAAVAAARAQVAQRTAELRNAQSTEQRAMELTEAKTHLQAERRNHGRPKRETAAAAVSAAQANLEQATQRARQGRRAERGGARGGREARAGATSISRTRASRRRPAV